MNTPQSILTDSLKLAPSELFVADLKNMTTYYKDYVGLEVLESSKDSALLGQDHVGIIQLTSKPKLSHAGPREAGLFHNAIVFGSRGELSRAAEKLITSVPRLFTGTGDHLVSEAFYFNDPESNGVELYFDRPSDTWQWNNGRVAMDTLYIDPVEYIHSNSGEQSTKDKKLGHVHLKVGDIDQAQMFYVDLLGFNITANIPGALFVSIGGYHHHIGLNSWMSTGAGLRQPSLGLSNVTITLGSDDNVSNLAKRLELAKRTFRFKNGNVIIADPWGNLLSFKA